MTFGVRPIGTRSFGDGAPTDSPPPAGGEEIFAEVSFTGTGTVTFGTSTLVQVSLSGTGDLDVNATNNLQWMRIEFSGTGTINTILPYKGTKRRVIVTDNEGNPFAELQNANVGPITYELNKPESWSFSLPADDPKVSAILAESIREVQLWRGDQLLSWGPMVRPQISSTGVDVSVSGALWHLGRRHIGKAERTNYITNGDFENGLAGWDFSSNPVPIHFGLSNAQGPPLHSIVNFPTLAGRRSLRLENTVAGADAWAGQAFLWEVDVDESPDGDEWTLVAYVYVGSFTAQASEGRGLYLERFSTTELNPDPWVQEAAPGTPKSIDVSFQAINEETPVGQFQRVEVRLKTPPKAGEPEIVNVRLYAPDGHVFWDRVSLTLDERTGFYGVDQATIAAELVQHLQDPAYDKSDVNISTNCPPTGVRRDRVYYHAEHPNGFRSIEEFTTLSNGFDVDVAYTPTNRIFRTHFPQKGRHFPKFALETGRNISFFSWTFDGEAASTSVIVLGTGDGSGREEGYAVDTSNFAGLTLEEVFVAPPDSRIESLDKIAIERLVTTTAPEVLAIRTTLPMGSQADPVGVLSVGDTVPVHIESGALSIHDTYRITRLSINPDDTLDLVLNIRSLLR